MNIDTLQEQPTVDLGTPTRESLLAEAAALGEQFTMVSGHPADLVADADEMLEAKRDLPDLIRRKYAVSEGLFTRIRLLRDEVSASLAQQDRVGQLSAAQTALAEDARRGLLQVRSELARIGKAARLPASLFSLETRKTTRLNVVMMKMEEVMANVGAVRHLMPDPDRVTALLTQARALIDQQKTLRTGARLMSIESSGQTLTKNQTLRLLYDALIHLSAQGLAAYPDDPARAVHYRLDHVYGRKPSVVGDPGAGGAGGEPDAAGPGGDEDVLAE